MSSWCDWAATYPNSLANRTLQTTTVRSYPIIGAGGMEKLKYFLDRKGSSKN
jgi:hypothetical protein